jgi:hypothetical protein
MPQTWREEAVRYNSVPIVSYRDAVWPIRDEPPTDLTYYWDGLSHPHFNAHVMVAEALLFAFLAARRNVDNLLKDYKTTSFGVSKVQLQLDDACVSASTHYGAGSFPGRNNPADSNCWEYRADSRDKFGWIGKASKNSTTCTATKFQVNVNVGKTGYVHLSYLASYDERMASVRAWIEDETGNSLSGKKTIISWRKERASIEANAVLRIPWRSIPELNNYTLNVELLQGTSHASEKDPENGVDKFKLLGLMSC